MAESIDKRNNLKINPKAKSRVLDLVEVMRKARKKKPTHAEVVLAAMDVLEAVLNREITATTAEESLHPISVMGDPVLVDLLAQFEQKNNDAQRATQELVRAIKHGVPPSASSEVVTNDPVEDIKTLDALTEQNNRITSEIDPRESGGVGGATGTTGPPGKDRSKLKTPAKSA